MEVRKIIIKIGYIGSKHTISVIEKLAKNISGIRLITYVYDSLSSIPDLHAKAVVETDVICFSGIVSYYYRNRSIAKDRPMFITPFHEYMLVSSLLSSQIHHDANVDEISIDIPDRHVVDHIQLDLKCNIPADHIYDYNWIYHDEGTKQLSVTEIAEFHAERYYSRKTKMAITSIHYVYDKLIELEVPVMYMLDHERNLTSVLKTAKQKMIIEHLRGGLIASIAFSSIDRQALGEKNIRRISNFVREELKIVQYELKHQHTLMFYTTKGVIEERLSANHVEKFLQQLEEQVQRHLVFGIGYAKNLYAAVENTETAVQKALELSDRNGFIVTEAKQIIGPLIGKSKVMSLRTDDWLNELTEKTNTNMKSILRFIDFMKLSAFQPFTVHQFSEYADISIRTAERFIKRFYDKNLLQKDGQEQSQMQGRPRNIYRLTETVENKMRLYSQQVNGKATGW